MVPFRDLVLLLLTIICTAGLLLFAFVIGYYIGENLKTELFIKQNHSIKQKLITNSSLLLNITNFYFKQNPKDICFKKFGKAGQKSKSIIAMVHSHRGNFLKREIIRKTYGSVHSYQGWSLQIVFALGLSSVKEDTTIEGILEDEIIEHGDIVIGSFEDTYRNMSYKHLMGYKWVIDFCKEAKYYIKIDDDVIVNIFHAIEFLSSNRSNKLDTDYYCYVYEGYKPMRDHDKWGVTLEEYPGDKYPNFCCFAVYIVGIETIKRILTASNTNAFFRLDDVFVTGILRERVNQVSENKINLINVYSYPLENILHVNHATGKDYLCVSDYTDSPFAIMSCNIWNSFLKVYGLVDVYVSTCMSLV